MVFCRCPAWGRDAVSAVAGLPSACLGRLCGGQCTSDFHGGQELRCSDRFCRSGIGRFGGRTDTRRLLVVFVPGKAVYLMIFECLCRGPFRMHERGRGVRALSPFPSGAVARRRQANIMESSPTYPMLDVLRVCPVPRSFCHGTLLSAQLVVPSGRPADASAVSGEILRHHHRGIRPQ
jgi:hypothetical protein